ncbi:MAG: hypothetical protein H7Z42_09425 [Roseiflexaceae bacterium]|nr:hypothetical protein [Roseiflexaceae bacterium]
MGIFRITEKDKLKLFRQHFRTATSQGDYPHEQQQKLFRWCQKVELDWNAARAYVLDDALVLLAVHLKRALDDRQITLAELIELRHLQRRLGIADSQISNHIQQFYNLIEHKFKDQIIERVAYFHAEPAVESLKRDLQRCMLPPTIEQRLLAVIDRQHTLAKLSAGLLPVITPSVDLYAGEACHFEATVRYLGSHGQQLSSGQGLLVATSQRLMTLSPGGGWAAAWRDLRGIQFRSHEWLHVGMQAKQVDLQIADAQYCATLIINAQRLYTLAAPTALLPSKRLA